MNKEVKKIISCFVLVSLGLLNGCATINFSANYYTPPENYQGEVRVLWSEFMSRVPLIYDYKINVASESEVTMGIPEIKNGIVNIPDSFIRYTFQNYYKDRFRVLLCIMAHEVCHIEYNLTDQSTPQAHFKVDQKAIDMLERTTTF